MVSVGRHVIIACSCNRHRVMLRVQTDRCELNAPTVLPLPLVVKAPPFHGGETQPKPLAVLLQNGGVCFFLHFPGQRQSAKPMVFG